VNASAASRWFMFHHLADRYEAGANSVILIPLGLSILFGIGLIVFAFRRAVRHPVLGLIVAGLLLALCLLSLELLLRIGFEYDLVRGHAPLPSFDGAPVTAALGVVLLLAAGTCVTAFVIAIVLLVRIWNKARPATLFMLTALAPPLLVLAFQYVAAASDAAARNAKLANEVERDERAGFEWARQHQVAKESACTGHSPAYIVGCRRYVASTAEISEERLAHNGALWAGRHDLESEEACASSSLVDFDDRPAFIAGCKAGVQRLNHGRGEGWARAHNILHQDDCRPGTEGFRDNPEFVAGCRSAVTESLRAAGANWAYSQYIFAVEDCSAAPGAKDNPGFVAGCEGLVRSASKSRNIAQGIHWAHQNRVAQVADCYGRVAKAPPDFEAGCERFVRDQDQR
jgi:hypothetical protein